MNSIHPFQIQFSHERLYLKHTWTISRSSSDYRENVIVKLEKDGITGLGECAHNPRYGESLQSCLNAIDTIYRQINHMDLWHYHQIGEIIQSSLEGQTSAKAGMEMAILDWVTKSLEIPLYQFLGLNPYRTPLTSLSIGIDAPEKIREKVKEAEVFPILKVKVGHDNEQEIINSVRSVTDKLLRVDVNEGWTNKEIALRKIEWLAQNNVEFIEQPLPAHMVEETAWLKARSAIPIFADEAVISARDIPGIAEAYDGINIKLMKSGGIQEALRMIAVARTFGLEIMLGCMIETSIAITAAAHLSPLADYADLDGHLLLADDPYQGVRVMAGKLILPNQPGLGVIKR